MANDTLHHFQEQAATLLLRHRSILDVLSKLQESNARTNRAITKAVTTCGCLNVNASKQQLAEAETFVDAKKSLDTHLRGELCEHCREVIELEMGNHLFYLASVCNLLDMRLNDIVHKEIKKLSTLGLFNFS